MPDEFAGGQVVAFQRILEAVAANPCVAEADSPRRQRCGSDKWRSIYPQPGKGLTSRTACLEGDHTVPHCGDWKLFVEKDNLQTLCNWHHAEKTSRDAEQLQRQKAQAARGMRRGFSSATSENG